MAVAYGSPVLPIYKKSVRTLLLLVPLVEAFALPISVKRAKCRGLTRNMNTTSLKRSRAPISVGFAYPQGIYFLLDS